MDSWERRSVSQKAAYEIMRSLPKMLAFILGCDCDIDYSRNKDCNGDRSQENERGGYYERERKDPDGTAVPDADTGALRLQLPS